MKMNVIQIIAVYTCVIGVVLLIFGQVTYWLAEWIRHMLMNI